MSAWKNFRALRRHLLPRNYTEGEGGLVGYALDLLKDAFVDRAYAGFLAGYPQNGPNGETAPPDALVLHGRDRLVYRGIFETDAEYAARLVTFLDEHETRGNPFTLMRQLHAYTGANHNVSFRTVDVRGNYYSRSATGVETALLKQENWDWDGDTSTTGDTSRWSRFWVIIYPGDLWALSSDNTYVNSGTFGGGGAAWPDQEFVWGFDDMRVEHAQTLRAIVADWKPDGTRCENIIVPGNPASFDPASPEPDGLWGSWGKVVGGVRVPARLSTARYLGR